MTEPSAFLIYLLHFEPALGRHQHYCGLTKRGNLLKRLADHRAGKGARLTKRASYAGCTLLLARLFTTNDPRAERRIKASGHFDRLCPYCQQPALAARIARSAPPRPARPDRPDWAGLAFAYAEEPLPPRARTQDKKERAAARQGLDPLFPSSLQTVREGRG